MEDKIEKKTVSLYISRSLIKELNHRLVNMYGNVFGHISKAFEEGLELWLERNKNNEEEGDLRNGNR